MKRGTPRHPKTLELSVILGIPIYSAVGILEMMWHFTAEFALDGGIGKHSDDAIAKALCWDGASMVLIEGLVTAKWLDRCECHRMRVHDWDDHADQTVQRVLAKRNQVFLPCYSDPSTVLAPSKMPLPLPLPKANTFGEDPPQKTPKKPKKRSTALPDNWKPNEKHRELSTNNGVDVDIELDKFRDYALSNNWTKADWDATFRNWIRKAGEYKASQSPLSPQATLPDIKYGIEGQQ